MALIRCKDCGDQISRAARACPHCGRPQSRGRLGRGAFGLVVLFGIAFVMMARQPSEGTGSPAASTCHSDWTECADNRELANNYNNMSDMRFDCETAAKKQARYGTPKFPAYSFGSFLTEPNFKSSGRITLIETDAQFQNGFGAMAHTRVSCLYDLKSKAVEKVDIAGPA